MEYVFKNLMKIGYGGKQILKISKQEIEKMAILKSKEHQKKFFRIIDDIQFEQVADIENLLKESSSKIFVCMYLLFRNIPNRKSLINKRMPIRNY